LRRLLNLCDRNSIPITFDIVGHLLLETCDGNHEGPYANNWFRYDPGTNTDTDPLFYAPDLIRMIQAADVDHEIATHTFSHVLCGETSPLVVERELEQVVELHERFGIDPPTSFVPPVHSPPPYGVLREFGIKTVRCPVELPAVENSVEQNGNLVDRIRSIPKRTYPGQILTRKPPVYQPEIINGIVESYTTWHAPLSAPFLPNGQESVHPIFRSIPARIRQNRHRRYLQRSLTEAIEQESYAHLWTHIFNISNEVQWPVIESFLESLDDVRRSNDLRSLTMDQLANQVHSSKDRRE
jgi:peptidoglycan/xylan/chitin deacetylase (PgdA/CDA1 family)